MGGSLLGTRPRGLGLRSLLSTPETRSPLRGPSTASAPWGPTLRGPAQLTLWKGVAGGAASAPAHLGGVPGVGGRRGPAIPAEEAVEDVDEQRVEGVHGNAGRQSAQLRAAPGPRTRTRRPCAAEPVRMLGASAPAAQLPRAEGARRRIEIAETGVPGPHPGTCPVPPPPLLGDLGLRSSTAPENPFLRTPPSLPRRPPWLSPLELSSLERSTSLHFTASPLMSQPRPFLSLPGLSQLLPEPLPLQPLPRAPPLAAPPLTTDLQGTATGAQRPLLPGPAPSARLALLERPLSPGPASGHSSLRSSRWFVLLLHRTGSEGTAAASSRAGSELRSPARCRFGAAWLGCH